jgi:hypothetical protein
LTRVFYLSVTLASLLRSRSNYLVCRLVEMIIHNIITIPLEYWIWQWNVFEHFIYIYTSLKLFFLAVTQTVCVLHEVWVLENAFLMYMCSFIKLCGICSFSFLIPTNEHFFGPNILEPKCSFILHPNICILDT